MVLDYIQAGLSSFILVLYLLSIFLLTNIRRKLKGNSRIAFTFFILSILVIAIRRLQGLFPNTKILFPIPYSIEMTMIVFALLFFLGVFYIHKSIHTGKSKGEKKAKSKGIRLLLGILAIMILVNLLYRFEFLNLADFFQPDVLSVIILLFVTTEIGVRSALNSKGKRKPEETEWFGIGIIALLFIALILGWVGLTSVIIETSKRTLEFVLFIFIIVEILR